MAASAASKAGERLPFALPFAAGFAAGTWLFLQTTGWLPYAEPYLWLKPGFFADANMAGYCTIFLAWIYREGREWFGI